MVLILCTGFVGVTAQPADSNAFKYDIFLTRDDSSMVLKRSRIDKYRDRSFVVSHYVPATDNSSGTVRVCEFLYSDLNSLKIRDRRRIRYGIIGGFFAGALAGAVVGTTLISSEVPWDSTVRSLYGVAGLGAGGLTGAVAGGLIGARKITIPLGGENAGARTREIERRLNPRP